MYIIQTQNNRTLKQHRLNDPFLALVLYWVTGAMSWPRYSALTFINLPGWCSAEGAAPSEKTAAFKRWKCDGFACAQTQKNTSKFSWKKKQMCLGFRPADSNPSVSSWLSVLGFGTRRRAARLNFKHRTHTRLFHSQLSVSSSSRQQKSSLYRSASKKCALE